MSDEAPMDLQLLDPGDPPDLVGPAIRRFRVTVVLLTVCAVIATGIVVAAAVVGVVSWQNRGPELSDYLTPTQLAILSGGGSNCTTPTFPVGGTRVTLLHAVPSAEGGWALHFVVEHGDGKPLAVRTHTSDGGEFISWSSLSAVGAASENGQVSAGLRWTVGEAYLGVPSSLGDRFDVQLIQQGDVSGTFTVDLRDAPRCRDGS